MKNLTLLLLLSFLTSCATPELMIRARDIKPYQGQSSLTRVAGAVAKFEIGEFQHQYQDGDEIGLGRTGANSQETPIRIDTPPSELVKKSLTEGLILRGVQIGAQNPDWILNGTIEKFEVQELKKATLHPEGNRCEIKMKIELTNGADHTKVWMGNLWVNYDSGRFSVDASAYNPQSIGTCLNLLVEELVKSKDFLRFAAKVKSGE